MKARLFTILPFLCFAGCSVFHSARYYPDERCVDATVRCIDVVGITRSVTYTPVEPSNEFGLIEWQDVDFEVLAPAQFAGKKILFPIVPESMTYLSAQKVYEIQLPLSVINGKPKYLGYHFESLEKARANKPPEAMAVERTPSNPSPAPAMPHL